MRTPHRPLVAAGLALALLLGACGSDDDTAAPTSTEAPADGPDTSAPSGDTPEEAGTGGDACALLDAATLDELISFEFGAGTWTAEEGSDGSCSWTNDDQLTTITVELRDGIDETLDELEAGSGTELEDVPVGAGTATGVRDLDADRLISLYVPAGADTIVKVTQSPLKVTDDDLVAVAEAAALAFENLPTAPDDGSGDAAAGGGAAGGATLALDAVAFTIQSSDAGLDLAFEVTAEEVRAAANPVTTMTVCAGVDAGDTGIFDGVYVVNGTDLDRERGLVSVTIESLDAVDGPGSYRGRLSANDTAGRSVEVDGDLAIDPGLRSGELIGEDESGNQVVATFECRPVG